MLWTASARPISGSPPQVRGKLIHNPAVCPRARITPAGAGKTRRFLQPHRRTEDHPRRCGENLSRRSSTGNIKGSPPQVRGKLGQKPPTIIIIRITPAGAGKTLIDEIQTEFNRDHPRRCGENGRFALKLLRYLGSPPQVRGKQLLLFLPEAICRITPAGAGKTKSPRMPIPETADHPRRCGENAAA